VFYSKYYTEFYRKNDTILKNDFTIFILCFKIS